MDFSYFLFIIMFATAPIEIDGVKYVPGDIVLDGSGILGAADTEAKCNEAGRLLAEKLNEIGPKAKTIHTCTYLPTSTYADAQRLEEVVNE